MEGGEGIGEVPDGEEEGEELSQGDHQGDGQAGALSREDKDGGDAEVLGDDVADEIEQHAGHHGENWEGRGGDENVPVVENVWSQEKESRQGEGMGVEQGFPGMLSML